MVKKYGQASMEYILVMGIVMLIFMVVLMVIYEKNSEIVQTKIFLEAKVVTNSIATNINTISVQGDGYYKYFTIPEKLYGETDYNITLYINSVELRWGDSPDYYYTWSKSLITANVNGSVNKGLNKVINCDGTVYIGNSSTSCE